MNEIPAPMKRKLKDIQFVLTVRASNFWEAQEVSTGWHFEPLFSGVILARFNVWKPDISNKCDVSRYNSEIDQVLKDIKTMTKETFF